MKHRYAVIGVALLALGLSACAAGTASSHHVVEGGDLSQLLLGLWHGFIAPVTLIIEVVNRLAPHILPLRLRMYESRDVGVAYDVGFYFGLLGGPLVGWRNWNGRR